MSGLACAPSLQVAAAMARRAAELRPQFIISTGDNVYEDGLRSSGDPLFTQSFTNVYSAPSLQLPWYSVLGVSPALVNEQVCAPGQRPGAWVEDARWLAMLATVACTLWQQQPLPACCSLHQVAAPCAACVH